MSSIFTVPLTAEEEEAQLELAIQQSLEEFGVSSPLNEQNENEISGSSSPAQHETAAPVASQPVRIPSARNPYNRSVSDFGGFTTSSPRQLVRQSTSLNSDSWGASRNVEYDCCDVTRLLEGGSEFKNTSPNTSYPLHHSIKRYHFECMETLLSSLPNCTNQRNQNGESPLHVAVAVKNYMAVERLLQAGADFNLPRLNRDTPLQAAVESGDIKLVQFLLRAGCNANQALNRGWTSLHEAVYQGNTEILRCLLNHKGDPNVRDAFGISPVFTSAACGRNDCLEMLLNAGGDPNLSALTKSAPPLYEACKEGHVACVNTLIKYDADPHIPNCDGLLPLHIASYKGSIQIVTSLLKVTKRSTAERCGMSPVHSAAKGDNIEILKMLVDSGYDVNRKLSKDKITYRDRRQTALFFAVDNDSEEAAEILLRAGARTDLDYVKPLLVAVTHGQYDMVDLLLRYGADINATFVTEGTLFPAAIAFSLKDYRMLRKLLLAGCNAEKCFSCPMGSRDHSGFEESFQKSSFCHFASESQNAPWMGCVAIHLFEYTGNVNLCSKMEEVLIDTDEWDEISDIIDKPRTLIHLCRQVIRNNGRLRANVLSLPPILQEYIEHNDS